MITERVRFCCSCNFDQIMFLDAGGERLTPGYQELHTNSLLNLITKQTLNKEIINMKKTITTVIFACIIGCGGEAEAKTLPTDEEIQSIPNVLIVPNTKTISYHLYRQEWRWR